MLGADVACQPSTLGLRRVGAVAQARASTGRQGLLDLHYIAFLMSHKVKKQECSLRSQI